MSLLLQRYIEAPLVAPLWVGSYELKTAVAVRLIRGGVGLLEQKWGQKWVTTVNT